MLAEPKQRMVSLVIVADEARRITVVLTVNGFYTSAPQVRRVEAILFACTPESCLWGEEKGWDL